MRRRLSVLLLLGLVCLPAAFAAGAPGQGELDGSFGQGGVVALGDYIPRARSLSAVAVAPDAGIYFDEQRSLCSRGGCPYSLRLKRLRPDGSLDSGFGVDGSPVTGRATPGELLVVDPASRPVVAWSSHGGRRGIFIRRFRRDGELDGSFANSGTLFLACGCYLDSLAIPPSGRPLVFGHGEPKGKGVYRWFVTRLLPSGAPDRGFGNGRGEEWLSVPGHYPPGRLAPLAGGATLIGGFRERGYDAAAPYVLRMSSGGQIDRGFSAATRRSLTGVYETSRNAVGWERLALVPLLRGGVEVYGDAYHRGVAIKLLPDGSRDRSFAGDGVTLLPFELNDAVPDSHGGAIAVGYSRQQRGYRVIRIDPSGIVDSGFGQLDLSQAGNEEGLQILSSGRGRAVVLDRDEFLCFTYCASHPKLFRLAAPAVR